MKLKDPRVVGLVTGTTLVLVLTLLVVQHFRHGWPFSLHHGVGAAHVTSSHTSPDVRQGSPVNPRAAVEISSAQLEAVGVRVEKVTQQLVTEPIRAVATVVPDEGRLSHVHTRVSGWIERLHVNTTGERVRAGQALASIFSQELLASQTEYLSARRAAAGAPRSVVAEGARSRLKVLGMSDAEIRDIEASGEPRRLVTVTAPRAGVVLRRGVSSGAAVDPSTELVTVADLTRVWVLAEVPEGDIPSVQTGTPARLEFPASGLEPIDALVEFMYPTLSERTRSLRVRFSVENKTGSLRPGLYGTATFEVEPRSALTVSRDAVVDTGSAQHVFVVVGEGHFVPRVVKLGARLGERVEVRDGLTGADSVVASGVFLIDSESRLRASGGGTGHNHGNANQTTPERHSNVQSGASPAPALTGKPTHVDHSTGASQVNGHEGH